MIKNYYKPTPAKWRKFGDALLAVSVAITTGGLLAFDTLSLIFSPHELKVIIGCAFAFGVIGKFLTNLFKIDKPE
jgi:hypothetical protein